ncbi:MAG: hypothetical protein ABSD56_00090 [Bryobacteraceae bacterium]|jgi:hypothetical protein
MRTLGGDKELVRETTPWQDDDAVFIRRLRRDGFTPYLEERRWRRRFYWLLGLASVLIFGFSLIEINLLHR